MIIIPELKGYFGGKGGSGTYQNIINLIPPHLTFVVPFLGHCGILRNIKPAKETITSDIDPFVIESWANFFYQKGLIIRKGDISFKCCGWEERLKNIPDSNDTVIYLDPTYPHDTRKSNHRYKFEMTDDNHVSLLTQAKTYQKTKVLISSYKNDLYNKHLKGWNTHSFPSMTRGGIAIETVYYNYPSPSRLHDYRYFGENYKQREHFKLKKQRLVSRFAKMSAVEQGFYMDALKLSIDDDKN